MPAPAALCTKLALLLALSACAARGAPFMVASANPHASRAGYEILQQGGSALDAAVAVQAVLTLVEPQSSGIGGGAFLLHWEPQTGTLSAYDGRETAPAQITPDLLLNQDGKPLDLFEAIVSGRSVGVPGVVALFAQAHKDHGRLPWQRLFAPAIDLAETGFALSPRLHGMLGWSPVLGRRPKANALFFDQPPGAARPPHPLPAGSLVKNRELAQSLRLIADHGAPAFYTGQLAGQIVRAVRRAPKNPGLLSARDMAAYAALRRAPVCRFYRGFKVCGVGPPSSGGIAILQILGILEGFDLAALPPGSLEAVHLISEASRLAYADRARYIADPGFFPVPVEALLAPAYLKKRARLISRDRALRPEDLAPGLENAPPLADMAAYALPATTHFTIRDARGAVVSMTSSIEAPFGSQLMAGGFFLNNQLTDFSFLPRRGGRAIANAPAPGKRPLSSMAPVIVFDRRGAFFAALGSPGGPRIIAYVAQTLIALIDWTLPMQEAINLPRHAARGRGLELEEGTRLEALIPRLRALGHAPEARRLTSGLHGIQNRDGRLLGGADPRREGVVRAGRLNQTDRIDRSHR